MTINNKSQQQQQQQQQQQLLIKQLTADDFSAERYVRDLSATCVVSGELQQQRQSVAQIGLDTDAQLKQCVYRHHGNFIDTARSVQLLESEVQLLADQLLQQRQLLQQLVAHVPDEAVAAAQSLVAPSGGGAVNKSSQDSTDMTAAAAAAVGDQSELNVDERRQQLLQLLARMEGGEHVRAVPQRHLLLDSELLELSDTGDHRQCRPLGRVRGCLLSDSLLLAAWLPERRGAVRYRFDALYLLDDVAVVNVRSAAFNAAGGSGGATGGPAADKSAVVHAFKLLLPTAAAAGAAARSVGTSGGGGAAEAAGGGGDGGVRMFQCASGEVKQRWIDTVDAVKRRRLFVQRRELSARRKHNHHQQQQQQQQQQPNKQQQQTAASNQEDESEVGSTDGTVPAAAGPAADSDSELLELPDWLQLAPEQLDELLVERRYEAALQLLQQAKLQLSKQSPSNSREKLDSLSSSIKARGQQLQDSVLQLLDVTAASQLHCHQLTVRRCLQLLEQLGAAHHATRLLLRRRSSLLRQQLRQLLVSCSQQQQLPQLVARLVVACVVATVTDFNDSFERRQPNCTAALVVWTRGEVAQLLATFSRYVFGPAAAAATPAAVGATLGAAAEGVAVLRQQAAALKQAGLDIGQQLSAGLRRQLTRAVADAKQQQLEAVRARAAEDRWLPVSAEQLSQPVLQQLQQLKAADGTAATPLLTANTLHFRDAFLQLVADVAQLRDGPRDDVDGEAALAAVLTAQLKHVQRAAAAAAGQKVSSQRRLVAAANGRYLTQQLLPEAAQQYRVICGQECVQLLALQSSFKMADI